jgi:TonB family protein
MTLAWLEREIMQPVPVPRLLVELPSWSDTFISNLRDTISPERLPQLELHSAPAPFWPDVFVKRDLPWTRFLQSGACHAIAFAILVGFTRLFALQPQVVAKPAFDHAQVVYYQPSEYLPPLDTRIAKAAQSQKADPELFRQPIISVPSEADNRFQTIVTPPSVKLKHDVAVANIVAWSDRMQKPHLAIPPVPLTPAAEITRIAPQMANPVVTPPPDATHLAHSRDSLTLQDSVVAPPPDLTASRSAPVFEAVQSVLIAPPPSVENTSNRVLGDLNIGRSAVINPAPQLAVGEQRALAGGRLSAAGGAPQVVAPPPSLSAAGSAGGPGRVIALSLNPAIGAPPAPPSGNRRGAFAATPEGHAGATGTPGSSGGKGTGNAANGKGRTELPSGLYVGSASVKTSPVAGAPGVQSSTQVNPNLLASASPPRVTSAPGRAMQPGNPAKLSEAERAVFGDRKFYSLTLNMPNLNSAGGSWVIRFAELKQDAKAPPADLSQPMATRKVDPAYPLQLMRENVSGTVILYAVIHADGTVGNVRVLRGVDERLDQFASQAVAQWQFQPATKNGAPVEVEATFQIPFRPARVGSNF